MPDDFDGFEDITVPVPGLAQRTMHPQPGAQACRQGLTTPGQRQAMPAGARQTQQGTGQRQAQAGMQPRAKQPASRAQAWQAAQYAPAGRQTAQQPFPREPQRGLTQTPTGRQQASQSAMQQTVRLTQAPQPFPQTPQARAQSAQGHPQAPRRAPERAARQAGRQAQGDGAGRQAPQLAQTQGRIDRRAQQQTAQGYRTQAPRPLAQAQRQDPRQAGGQAPQAMRGRGQAPRQSQQAPAQAPRPGYQQAEAARRAQWQQQAQRQETARPSRQARQQDGHGEPRTAGQAMSRQELHARAEAPGRDDAAEAPAGARRHTALPMPAMIGVTLALSVIAAVAALGLWHGPAASRAVGSWSYSGISVAYDGKAPDGAGFGVAITESFLSDALSQDGYAITLNGDGTFDACFGRTTSGRWGTGDGGEIVLDAGGSGGLREALGMDGGYADGMSLRYDGADDELLLESETDAGGASATITVTFERAGDGAAGAGGAAGRP